MRDEKIKRADANWPLRIKKYYYSIMHTYALDENGYEVLLLACNALARYHEAKKILDREGLTYETAQGMRKHPANEIEKVCRSQAMAALKLLGINDGDTKRDRGGRPPGPVKDLRLL